MTKTKEQRTAQQGSKLFSEMEEMVLIIPSITAEISKNEFEFNNLIMIALKVCTKHNFQKINVFVQPGEVDINSCDCYGVTALHEAAEAGNLQMVKFLVGLGTVVKFNVFKESPIYRAQKRDIII